MSNNEMFEVDEKAMCLGCGAYFPGRLAGVLHENAIHGPEVKFGDFCHCKGELRLETEIAIKDIPAAALARADAGLAFDRWRVVEQYRGIPKTRVPDDPLPGFPVKYNAYNPTPEELAKLDANVERGRIGLSLDAGELPTSTTPGLVRKVLLGRIDYALETFEARTPLRAAIKAHYTKQPEAAAFAFLQMIDMVAADPDTVPGLLVILSDQFKPSAAPKRDQRLDDANLYAKLVASGDIIPESRWFLASWVNPNWKKRAELVDFNFPNALVLPFQDIYGGYVRLPVMELAPLAEDLWPRACRSIRFPDGTRQPTALRKDAHNLPFFLDPVIEDVAPMVFGNLKLDRVVPFEAVKRELFRQEAAVELDRKRKANAFINRFKTNREADVPKPTPPPIRVTGFAALDAHIDRFPSKE